MRLLLAGPPKTGNVWVEALLAGAYGLDILRPPDVPGAEAALLDDFVTDGRFPQRSIFHQHFVPSDDVFEVAARHDIRLLAVLRDPYDTFVSLFFYIQRFAADYERSGDHGASLIGCSLGDQAVFDYIRDIYGHHLRVAAGWAAAGRAGRALAVRYEDLHRDTAGSLARIGVALGSPIPLLRRRRAVRAATAGRM